MDKSLGAATSAAAAANEFLRLGWREPSVPPIDQMKLQKLLFYCHAWHLAIKSCPLFGEDFEAWPWGPVVRNIYLATKGSGKLPIKQPITDFDFSDPSAGGWALYEPKVTSEDTLRFIGAVWLSHKNFTGVQLSNSTHAPGEPWAVIKETYGNLENKPSIPNELIYTIFKKKLDGGN